MPNEARVQIPNADGHDCSDNGKDAPEPGLQELS